MKNKFERHNRPEAAVKKLVAAGMDVTSDKAAYNKALADVLRAETICPSGLR